MKIISLQSENFKRIKAVEITPDKDGNLVMITGRNEQGKSSVLDSIKAAMGGKDAVPKEPIRRGTKSAKIKLDLGDMVVERKFSAGNTYLKITAKDGTEVKGPQQLLDKLVGKLSFDPLEFMNLKAENQLKILKDLAGLDFTAIDQKKTERYEARTETNRELVSIKARLENIPVPDDKTPDEEVSVTELTAKLTRASDTNSVNKDVRDNLRVSQELLVTLEEKKSGYENEMTRGEKEYEKELARIKKEHEQEVARIKKDIDTVNERITKGVVLVAKTEKQVAGLKDIDTAPITKAITDSQETNRLIRQKKERAALKAERDTLTKQSEKATRDIEEIDAKKETMIQEAKMPIKGLSFDDSGIRLNDTRFSQLCDSEKLKVGLAISIALNPKIKVILIRDGSLLDSTNLAVVKEMAEKNNSQVWLEKVDESGKIGIVIEDGSIQEAKEEVEV